MKNADKRNEVRNALLNGDFGKIDHLQPQFLGDLGVGQMTSEVSTQDCNYPMLTSNDNDKKNICTEFHFLILACRCRECNRVNLIMKGPNQLQG